jgi:hypothetical protein
VIHRLSFRDEQGNMRECEVTASTMSLAVRGNNEPFELVKVERIDHETGVVLGGRHYE